MYHKSYLLLLHGKLLVSRPRRNFYLGIRLASWLRFLPPSQPRKDILFYKWMVYNFCCNWLDQCLGNWDKNMVCNCRLSAWSWSGYGVALHYSHLKNLEAGGNSGLCHFLLNHFSFPSYAPPHIQKKGGWGKACCQAAIVTCCSSSLIQQDWRRL